MKPRFVLLYAPDHHFDPVLSEALRGSQAVLLSARSVSAALQIICRRGRELDLAILDFSEGCRGMTLLSAIQTCFEDLPVLVTICEETEHVTAVAYANGARVCLNRSLPSSQLANTISDVMARDWHRIAA
jgi:DNA-binding NtrC family response regulator